MTAYLSAMTSTQHGSGFSRHILTPTSFAVKISRVVYVSTSGQCHLYRTNSGTSSGGTSITPVPMRSGGPAATATSKYNVSSVSGTATYFVHANSEASPYQSPFDLIVAPGNVFVVEATNGPTLAIVSIYFEELRLAYSL